MKTLLYGLRASGKTSVLSKIQERMGVSGLDLDRCVVQEMQKKHSRIQSITDFVEGIGNIGQFRDIEHHTLKDLITDDSLGLLALGGGTIAYDRNRHFIDPVDNYLLNPHTNNEAKEHVLKTVFTREKYPKTSVKVFLDISPGEQLQRLEKDDEGNKDRPDLGKGLQELYDERVGNYMKFADIRVQVDGKTIEDVVDEILGNSQIRESIKKAA